MKLRRTKVLMGKDRGGHYYRYEVTIPREAVDAAGWELGVELEWSEEGGTIILRPKKS